MIFFHLHDGILFLAKNNLHVFTYYISKSQHGESASVLHTNEKKKKLIIKILKEVALCMNNIQF